MNKLAKILSITGLAWSLGVPAQAETPIDQFQDIPTSFWGNETISWGINQQMVSGYPDQTFRPNQPVKETEFLSMLLRYYASQTDQMTFEAGGTHWAEAFYKSAKEYNLPVSAMPSDKAMNRGDVAKLIAATQGFNFSTNNAVQYLYNLGISNGRKGTFRLEDFGKQSNLTRAEAIQFIKNLSDKGITTLKPRETERSAPLIQPSSELFPFTGANRMMGYKDAEGRIMIDPQFSVAGDFQEGLAPVYFNQKWGFVDLNGELAIPLQFDEVRKFSEGLAAVRIGKNYGYVNKSGQLVIPAQYDLQIISAYSSDLNQYDIDFHHGYAVARIGNKFGLINQSGKLVTTQKFDQIRPVSEGMAAVWVEGKIGYINTAGKIVIKPQYEIVGDFHEGVAAAGGPKQYGYIDKTGKVVIKPELTYIFPYWPTPDYFHLPTFDFHQGLAPVKEKGKYGYIDKAGKFVIPPMVEAVWVHPFVDGMALVNTGGVAGPYGFIDKTGKLVVPARYYQAKPFSEDLAAVTENDKWGYIDRSGNVVIEPQFTEAHPFMNGIAKVAIDPDGTSDSREYLYIDKQGNRVD